MLKNKWFNHKLIFVIWAAFLFSCTKGTGTGTNAVSNTSYAGNSNRSMLSAFLLTQKTDSTVAVNALIGNNLTCNLSSGAQVTGVLVSATMPYGTDLANLTATLTLGGEGSSYKQVQNSCFPDEPFLASDYSNSTRVPIQYIVTANDGISKQIYFVTVTTSAINMAALKLVANSLITSVTGTGTAISASSTTVLDVSQAIATGYTEIYNNFVTANALFSSYVTDVNNNLAYIVAATNTSSITTYMTNLSNNYVALNVQKSILLNLNDEAQINLTLAQTQSNLLTTLYNEGVSIAGPHPIAYYLSSLSAVLGGANGNPSISQLIANITNQLSSISVLDQTIIGTLARVQSNLSSIKDSLANVSTLVSSTAGVVNAASTTGQGVLAVNQANSLITALKNTIINLAQPQVNMFIGSYVGASPAGTSYWCGTLQQSTQTLIINGVSNTVPTYQYPQLTITSGTSLVYQMNQYTSFYNSTTSATSGTTSNYEPLTTYYTFSTYTSATYSTAYNLSVIPAADTFNTYGNVVGTKVSAPNNPFTASFGYDVSTSTVFNNQVSITVDSGLVIRSAPTLLVDNKSTYTINNCSLNQQAMSFLNKTADTVYSTLATATSSLARNTQLGVDSLGAGVISLSGSSGNSTLFAGGSGGSGGAGGTGTGLSSAELTFLSSSTNVFATAWTSAQMYYGASTAGTYITANGANQTSAYWQGYNDGKSAQYALDSMATSNPISNITNPNGVVVPASGVGSNTPYYMGAAAQYALDGDPSKVADADGALNAGLFIGSRSPYFAGALAQYNADRTANTNIPLNVIGSNGFFNGRGSSPYLLGASAQWADDIDPTKISSASSTLGNLTTTNFTASQSPFYAGAMNQWIVSASGPTSYSMANGSFTTPAYMTTRISPYYMGATTQYGFDASPTNYNKSTGSFVISNFTAAGSNLSPYYLGASAQWAANFLSTNIDSQGNLISSPSALNNSVQSPYYKGAYDQFMADRSFTRPALNSSLFSYDGVSANYWQASSAIGQTPYYTAAAAQYAADNAASPGTGTIPNTGVYFGGGLLTPYANGYNAGAAAGNTNGALIQYNIDVAPTTPWQALNNPTSTLVTVSGTNLPSPWAVGYLAGASAQYASDFNPTYPGIAANYTFGNGRTPSSSSTAYSVGFEAGAALQYTRDLVVTTVAPGTVTSATSATVNSPYFAGYNAGTSTQWVRDGGTDAALLALNAAGTGQNFGPNNNEYIPYIRGAKAQFDFDSNIAITGIVPSNYVFDHTGAFKKSGVASSQYGVGYAAAGNNTTTKMTDQYLADSKYLTDSDSIKGLANQLGVSLVGGGTAFGGNANNTVGVAGGSFTAAIGVGNGGSTPAQFGYNNGLINQYKADWGTGTLADNFAGGGSSSVTLTGTGNRLNTPYLQGRLDQYNIDTVFDGTNPTTTRLAASVSASAGPSGSYPGNVLTPAQAGYNAGMLAQYKADWGNGASVTPGVNNIGGATSAATANALTTAAIGGGSLTPYQRGMYDQFNASNQASSSVAPNVYGAVTVGGLGTYGTGSSPYTIGYAAGSTAGYNTGGSAQITQDRRSSSSGNPLAAITDLNSSLSSLNSLTGGTLVTGTTTNFTPYQEGWRAGAAAQATFDGSTLASTANNGSMFGANGPLGDTLSRRYLGMNEQYVEDMGTNINASGSNTATIAANRYNTGQPTPYAAGYNKGASDFKEGWYYGSVFMRSFQNSRSGSVGIAGTNLWILSRQHTLVNFSGGTFKFCNIIDLSIAGQQNDWNYGASSGFISAMEISNPKVYDISTLNSGGLISTTSSGIYYYPEGSLTNNSDDFLKGTGNLYAVGKIGVSNLDSNYYVSWAGYSGGFRNLNVLISATNQPLFAMGGSPISTTATFQYTSAGGLTVGVANRFAYLGTSIPHIVVSGAINTMGLYNQCKLGLNTF